MAETVTRVVTADVYAWMTPIEGVPGRWHHNTAARGEEIEVSAEEAKRGEGLGLLESPSGDAEQEDVVDEGAGNDAPPPRTANKAAWVDFAVAQGADRDEAEKASKDDLIATYGA